MIKIHVTKKLFAKLPINEKNLLPKQASTQLLQAQTPTLPSALSGWHGNLITLQRRNCILLAHDTTRFPLFIPCLTKPDFDHLNMWFEDALMNTLIKAGAYDNQLNAVHHHLAPLQIDTDCNRSVQGTMNQMKADLEHMLWVENVDITEVSGPLAALWLSGLLRKVKGQKDYITPQKEMLSLLSLLATGDVPANTLPGNVIDLKDYRNG